MMAIFIIESNGIKSAQAQGPSKVERIEAKKLITLLKCIENTQIAKTANYQSMLHDASMTAQGK